MEEAKRTLREMEIDEHVIDPNTIVRNLKTNEIELREKIFLDKKISKQLELSLEERPNGSQRRAKRQANGGFFSTDVIQ